MKTENKTMIIQLLLAIAVVATKSNRHVLLI